MWTVVYVMSNRSEAETMKQALMEEGILAMLRAAGSAHGSEHGPVEILVLESEAEEASEVINKTLSTMGGSAN
ncbi:MAG TPA: glutamate decarboxylase [Clostridia bacterium]|nr:glutamate decarboxylase [Clostridia bacterium]